MSSETGPVVPPAPWRWERVDPGVLYSKLVPEPRTESSRDAWLREPAGKQGWALVGADGTVLVESEGGWGSPDIAGGMSGPVAELLARAPEFAERVRQLEQQLTGRSPTAEKLLARFRALPQVDPAAARADLDAGFDERLLEFEEGLVHVVAVEVLGGYRLRLGWSDGAVGVVDVGPLLYGPVFEAIRDDPAVFAAVRVDAEVGTIVWPNGADLAPEALRRLACVQAIRAIADNAGPRWVEPHRSGDHADLLYDQTGLPTDWPEPTDRLAGTDAAQAGGDRLDRYAALHARVVDAIRTVRDGQGVERAADEVLDQLREAGVPIPARPESP